MAATYSLAVEDFEIAPDEFIDLWCTFEVQPPEGATDVAPGSPLTLVLESAEDCTHTERYNYLTPDQIATLELAALNHIQGD